MKSILCVLLLTAGILLPASSTSLQAQPCQWRICNEIDCSLNFRVYLGCPTPAPVSSPDVIGPGCWGNPTCKNFVVSQCNPPAGCNYSVSINGTFYQNGDIICCDSHVPPEECSTCNCAYVEIDPVNHIINLVPATSGPGWDCDPPPAVR